MTIYQTTEIKLLPKRNDWHTPCYGEVWQFSYWQGGVERLGKWLLGCPSCGKVAFLQHTVTIENNVPTIYPSIICPFCVAHYWVSKGRVVQAMAADETKDLYPAPEGNFKQSFALLVKSHVALGNVVSIAIALFFLPKPWDVLISVIAATTIVDTWVHKFWH